MLTLTIEVPDARDRTAFATLRDGFKTILKGNAVASATPAIAASHGNPACDPLRQWGHPPLGRYVLLNREATPHGQTREYGDHLLLFVPESGAALEAESFGRLAMLVYAGPADLERRLRPTQGGVRLTDGMLTAIVNRLNQGDEMLLDLVPLHAPSWWQFWKRPMTTQRLSARPMTPVHPPLDELSLLNDLLRRSVRRARPSPTERRDDDTFRDRRDDRPTSGRSSEPEPFQGKGGAFGGAGASGGWEAAGKGPGVDQSGRIIAAAAAAGAISAAAMSATGDSDSGDTETGAGSESSMTTSTSY